MKQDEIFRFNETIKNVPFMTGSLDTDESGTAVDDREFVS